MQIDEERLGGITVLKISGELDARTLPDATTRLDTVFAEMRKSLVFNLSGIDIVTSTGISFLLDAAKRARALGGDAVLSEPSRLLERNLKALEIPEFFKTFPNDAAAISHFRDQELDDTEVRRDEPPPKKGWFRG